MCAQIKKVEDTKKQRFKINRSLCIIFCLFIFIPLILALFGLGRIKSTEVTIKLAVNELYFKLMQDWEICSIKTNNLSIANFKNLELHPLKFEEAVLFDSKTKKPKKWRNYHSEDTVKIKGKEQSYVSFRKQHTELSSFSIKSGAIIKLSMDDSINRLQISNAPVIGIIQTGEKFEITCNYCQISGQAGKTNKISRTFRIETQDRLIEFTDRNGLIYLELEILQNKWNPNLQIFGKAISIDSIGFTKLENDEIVSTIIQDGSIQYARLDDKEYNIGSGDFLVIDGLTDFQIKRLMLEDQIKVILNGRVKKVKSGSLKFLNSRMPYCLEWTQKNQRFALFIGTLGGVYAFILVIWQLVKYIKEAKK